jgi:hypothetical protein
MIKCQVCETEIEPQEISGFSGLTGLPSPCCNTCVAVMDFTIKSLEDLKVKSLAKRIIDGNTEAGNNH